MFGGKILRFSAIKATLLQRRPCTRQLCERLPCARPPYALLLPGSAAASLVVRAAGPWSVATHELFPAAQSEQAVSLTRSLYQVHGRWLDRGGFEAVDFVRAIVPLLVCR